MGKRVFISFDYDNDRREAILLAGQAKNKNVPFEFDNWSLKERQKESEWKKNAIYKIQRSNILLVYVGNYTHYAPGVLFEIKAAKVLKKKIIQIKKDNDRNYVAPVLNLPIYNWSWNNLEILLS